MSSEAFVTLVTNDTYGMGALVLAHSLHATNTRAQLVVLITPGVTDHMKNTLSSVYHLVQSVDLIQSTDTEILEAMKRPELGVTLSKIHCWRLTQYQKCVFLDADCLVVKNIDELFEKQELSAVPDIGWPDCFNSGVFVFSPSEETFRALLKTAIESGSFDGGDQGLLNSYFSDWQTKDIARHLSFIYNMSSIAVYSYPPAYRQFGKNVKVIHFLGSLKPWFYPYNVLTGQVMQPKDIQGSQQLDHVQQWWNVFMSKVQSTLTTEDTGGSSQTGSQSPPPPELEVHASHGERESGSSPPVHHDYYIEKVEVPAPGPPQGDHEFPQPFGVAALQLREEPAVVETEGAANEHKPDDTTPEPNQRLHETEGETPDPGLPISESSLHKHELTNKTNELTEPESGLAGTLSKIHLSEEYGGIEECGGNRDEFARQKAWESGQIDYLGTDSFANILKKINEAINAPASN